MSLRKLTEPEIAASLFQGEPGVENEAKFIYTLDVAQRERNGSHSAGTARKKHQSRDKP
jgi:hypothetical protein